jgi:hypothetical protein
MTKKKMKVMKAMKKLLRLILIWCLLSGNTPKTLWKGRTYLGCDGTENEGPKIPAHSKSY